MYFCTESNEVSWPNIFMRKKVCCMSHFRECRQFPSFIFFVLQYSGDFYILSMCEVSDSRAPAAMARTQCMHTSGRVNILHMVLVIWAIRLPWHSLMPHFVLVIFVCKWQRLTVVCPYTVQRDLSGARLEYMSLSKRRGILYYQHVDRGWSELSVYEHDDF